MKLIPFYNRKNSVACWDPLQMSLGQVLPWDAASRPGELLKYSSYLSLENKWTYLYQRLQTYQPYIFPAKNSEEIGSQVY